MFSSWSRTQRSTPQRAAGGSLTLRAESPATRRACVKCAAGATAVSDAAGEPRCDLLDQPRIAVRIIEGEERPVARALGVGAGKACLQGKRRAVPHLTRVDATADKFVMSRFDVGDNQRTHGRARRCPSYSLAERDRAP